MSFKQLTALALCTYGVFSVLPNDEGNTQINVKAEQVQVEDADRAFMLKQMSTIELKKPATILIQSEQEKLDAKKASRQAQIDKINELTTRLAKYGNKPYLTGEEAVRISDEFNIPLDFILVQGLKESNFGTAGRAVLSKNTFNVGNVTEGDGKPTNCNDGLSKCYSNVQAAHNRWANLVTSCYLRPEQPRTIQAFMDNGFRIQQVTEHCRGVGVGNCYMAACEGAIPDYAWLLDNIIYKVVTPNELSIRI